VILNTKSTEIFLYGSESEEHLRSSPGPYGYTAGYYHPVKQLEETIGIRLLVRMDPFD